MRALKKALKEFNSERKHYKSIWEMIYLSDWFDPIYKLTRIPFKLINYCEKFYYYGKIGASNCYDFESHGIYDLIYAHMKRVKKHMHSDKTHLVWNSNSKNGLMRKLDEFTELSKRMSYNEMDDHYNFTKTREEAENAYGMKNFFNINYPNEKTKDKWDKKIRIVMKKDDMIKKERINRYYYLMKNVVPRFWD